MFYHNITHDDMLNGQGLRVVLWLSGCNHKCPECQNPITWNPQDGIIFETDAYLEILDQLDKSYISGITFSGGDPLYPETRIEITELAKDLKNKYPNKNIWCYTGYEWNQVKDLEIMKYIDVLVDGEFKKDLLDVNYHWAGSTNQKVIDVQASLISNKIILLGENADELC